MRLPPLLKRRSASGSRRFAILTLFAAGIVGAAGGVERLVDVADEVEEHDECLVLVDGESSVLPARMSSHFWMPQMTFGVAALPSGGQAVGVEGRIDVVPEVVGLRAAAEVVHPAGGDHDVVIRVLLLIEADEAASSAAFVVA